MFHLKELILLDLLIKINRALKLDLKELQDVDVFFFSWLSEKLMKIFETSSLI
jgi:hypothetical protein